MLRFISLFVLSEHCVQDGQQFTHTVNQRHFFGFSGCWQMHVKRLYHRIKPGYHKRCHVQGCSCLRTRTGVVRPADMCGITGMLSSIVLTSSASGRVLRDQLTTFLSKQSTTGDSQTFPAGSWNSVISVSHF